MKSKFRCLRLSLGFRLAYAKASDQMKNKKWKMKKEDRPLLSSLSRLTFTFPLANAEAPAEQSFAFRDSEPAEQ